VELALLSFARTREQDALFPWRSMDRYHTAPEQAAHEANEAGVRMLVFNHMSPIAPDNIVTRRIFARGVSSSRPGKQWMLGYDGLLLTQPQGTTTTQSGRVPKAAGSADRPDQIGAVRATCSMSVSRTQKPACFEPMPRPADSLWEGRFHLLSARKRQRDAARPGSEIV